MKEQRGEHDVNRSKGGPGSSHQGGSHGISRCRRASRTCRVASGCAARSDRRVTGRAHGRSDARQLGSR
jgi:hypothetical protein